LQEGSDKAMKQVSVLLVALVLTACGGGGSSGGGASAPPVNTAPTAIITVSSPNGYSPLTVEFDGSSSTDREGDISTYEWHTGDGSAYAGSQISHTYTELGSFSATLTVTDSAGIAASTSVTIDVHAQAAGYYYGEFKSEVTGQQNYIEVQIGSDHRVYAFQLDSWSGSWDLMAYYNGVVEVIEDTAAGSLLAETWDAYVFPDGSQLGNINFDAFVDPKYGILGTYSGVGDSGITDLFYDDDINQPKSLIDIEGAWSWSDGLGYEEIMIVDADGAFTYSDSDGCTFSGQFTPIDPALNEFDLEYDLIVATCQAGSWAGDGLRNGLANINDVWYDDVWLEWAVTMMEGPEAGKMVASSLMRSRQNGAVAGYQKTMPSTSHNHRRTRK
jgi:PKD repeat protein